MGDGAALRTPSSMLAERSRPTGRGDRRGRVARLHLRRAGGGGAGDRLRAGAQAGQAAASGSRAGATTSSTAPTRWRCTPTPSSQAPRVAIVDDLLATGGTAQATVELVREQGAEVAVAAFVVELGVSARAGAPAGRARRVAHRLLRGLPCRSAAASPRARPASCTSATRARRCSPGSTRARRAARSSCASRISIARACSRRRGAAARELRWLGLDWDEGPDRGGPFAPYRQSERAAALRRRHRAAAGRGRAFLCACSRADVARAASAPHDEQEPRYPGTCRDADPRRGHRARGGAGPGARRPVRGTGRADRFVDEVHGAVAPEPDGVDDFVLRRADGTAAYQLAVVVDDAAMEVTRVVRGDDLLSLDAAADRALPRARPRAAGLRARPAGGHRRAASGWPSGRAPQSLASLRTAACAPEIVVGALAASAGLSRRASLCPPRRWSGASRSTASIASRPWSSCRSSRAGGRPAGRAPATRPPPRP